MQIYKTAEYKPHFYAKIAGCDPRFLWNIGKPIPFRQFVAHSLSIINHIGDMRLISQVLVQFGD